MSRKEPAIRADDAGEIVLRAMTSEDAPACVALSHAVGWPHRLEDWRMVIGLGRGVVVQRGGEILAVALAWLYGSDHAALGMIIVSPGHQGAGIGGKLMRWLLDETGGRSLLLNATEAGRPLYTRHGFVPCGEVRQYQGEVLEVAAPVLAPGETLRPGRPEDLPLLERLDRQANGLRRGAVLAALLAHGRCVLLERGGEPVGFSILRRFGRGEVVGPVVAPDLDAARLLIAHWLAGARGRFLRLDVPAQAGLDGWLVSTGLMPTGSALTMRRGDMPASDGPRRRFALASQALG